MIRRLLPGLIVVPFAVGGLVVTGCSSAPRDSGFGDVRNLVHERTGHRVVWDTGSSEDGAARDAIAELIRREMSAESAVQVALLNNQDLQATYEDLGVAQAELVRAGLLRNPVFDAEVKFVEGGGGEMIELAVVQDFLDVFQIPLRQRVAAAELEAAKLRVAGEAIDLAGRVRAAFYELQAAQQLLEMRRSVLAAAEASFDLARRLRDAGNISELAFNQERALYEQSKVDLADVEAQVPLARERLNELMGLWGPETTWTADARLPVLPVEEPPVQDLERRAIDRSIELAAARQALDATARTLGLRRSFALFGEAEAGAAAEREPDGEWAVGPAVAVPIPLFDTGQASVAAARAEYRRSQKQLTATAVRVRAAARSAHAQLAAARDRARYYRDVIVPLRHQITEQSQLQLNAMAVGPFQLLEAKRQEIEAGAASIRALRDYWIARTRLDQLLTGGRMTDVGGGSRSNQNETSSPAGMSGGGGH